MAQVQLTTDIKNFKGYSVTAASSLTQRTATTTKPVDATGTKIIGSSLNYLKFRFFNSANQAPTIYIYGWSFNSDTMSFEPQLLFSGTSTLTSGTHSHPEFGTVYETANFTKVTGDAKIFSGPAGTGNGGFILVDTLGSQFVEVQLVASSGTVSFTCAGV
jgi:hypothetical protein